MLSKKLCDSLIRISTYPLFTFFSEHLLYLLFVTKKVKFFKTVLDHFINENAHNELEIHFLNLKGYILVQELFSDDNITQPTTPFYVLQDYLARIWLLYIFDIEREKANEGIALYNLSKIQSMYSYYWNDYETMLCREYWILKQLSKVMSIDSNGTKIWWAQMCS